MNKFFVFEVAENAGDGFGAFAFYARSFCGTVVDEAAGDFESVAVETTDEVAAAEFAFYVCDADGKQAAALLGEHSGGAAVEYELSFDLQLSGEPLLAGCYGLLGGAEQCADVFAVGNGGKNFGVTAADNYGAAA